MESRSSACASALKCWVAHESTRSARSRCAAVKKGHSRKSRLRTVSISLELRLLLGRKRAVRAAKVLSLHTDGLRPGFRIDRFVHGHVPFRVQHLLGHCVRKCRTPGKFG